MLQSSDHSYGVKSSSPASNPNSFNPVKTVSAPIEQATIGRTLVIKGEVSGAESLYIDGRIEGKITLPDNRVTIGRNGSVQANISAREVVVRGRVEGKIAGKERVQLWSTGYVSGEISTQRLAIEDGAVLRGKVETGRAVDKSEDRNAVSATKSNGATVPAGTTI